MAHLNKLTHAYKGIINKRIDSPILKKGPGIFCGFDVRLPVECNLDICISMNELAPRRVTLLVTLAY